MVRRRGRYPRTHGRTAISVVVVSDSRNILAKKFLIDFFLTEKKIMLIFPSV
jgi:hypothetical protein